MPGRWRRPDNWNALLLVAPFCAVYLALFVYPSVQMFVMSFTDSGLILPGRFVGLDNYIKLLGDRKVFTSVINSLYFVGLTVVPITLSGLALAMLVHRLDGIVRAIVLAVLFVPYILPVSTVTTMAWWLTDPLHGPLGGLVHGADGGPAVLWRNIWLFLPGVAVMTIWWTTGFSVLVFLAGLRALPRDLFEAARLEGANRWSSFRYLTWPLMWPVTALMLTIQLIIQIKVFDQVYLMIASGRTDPTMVLVQYIYMVAFQRNQGGYAATIAVALFLIVVTISVLQFQLLRLRSAR